MFIITFFFSGLLYNGYVDAFPNGAPRDACLGMFPEHSAMQQVSPSPFRVTLLTTSYMPSDIVNITLAADVRRKFIGVELIAHIQNGDRRVGSFTSWPEDKIKASDCVDSKAQMVTHRNNLPVDEVHVTWKAPDYNVGNITFRATFVESFKVFWIDVTSHLQSTVAAMQPPVERTILETTSIEFDSCGETLGCLLYPRLCNGSDCDVAMTYKTDGDNVTFVLFSKMHNYIAVGFSEDRKMGDDQTIICLSSDTGPDIQCGWNPSYYNEKQYKNGRLHNMRISHEDGLLVCSFTRPKAMVFYNDDSQPITVDLDKDYYVQMAWGNVYEGTQVIEKHEEYPITSTERVDFNNYSTYTGESLPFLTKLHGMLALIAWILFAGITTIITRYYKPILPEKYLCGSQIWFQLNVTHGWVGIAVMSAVTLQVIGGILRPGPKSGYRTFFNWLHWFLGKATHILAASCILLAFNADFITKSQRFGGNVVTILWIGMQCFWEIIFEVRQRCTRKSKSDKYKDDIDKEKEAERKLTTLDIVLLILYILTLLSLIAGGVIAICAF